MLTRPSEGKVEVVAVPNLAGSTINYASAVKAGPWIFMTGHEAFDFATGAVPGEVAGAAGFPLFGKPRFRREGDYILSRMAKVLKDYGSSFAHGVRLDQYYPTPAPVDPYHHSRKAVFGPNIPPSTSVVMEGCFNSATSISASMIAVVDHPDYEIKRYFPKSVAAPTWSGFAPAISCNEFVFVAGQIANTGDGDIDPVAHVPPHARWGGSEIRKQTEYLIVEKLKVALDVAGSSLEQSLKAQVYITGLDLFPDFMDVWQAHFARIPCALTVVPTKSFGTVDAVIEINLIALKNDAKRKKEVIEAGLPAMSAYGPCVKAGEFLFPSALMAIDEKGMIASGDVSLALPGLALGGSAQAAKVYAYAEALCKAAGTSMANVLRAQYFVPQVSEFAGIAAAWTDAYGEQPHPFVCVQTPEPLPALNASLLADFWIYVP